MNTLITITREETKGAKLADVITYVLGKVMDFKGSHAEIHIPETEKMMECVIMIDYDHVMNDGFSFYYRSFYTNDDGEDRFCDSTNENCDYASQIRTAIIADNNEHFDLYDRIDIIEGKAPICTHP